MSIAEIEAAIQTLSKDQLAQFDQWYQDFVHDQWDEQIRADLAAGRLDALLDEARHEKAAGTLRPFP